MDYQEVNKYVEILREKPRWFFQSQSIDKKLACLDKFMYSGTPPNITFLFEFLKHEDKAVRTKTADAIIQIYPQLKTANDLYESLKFIRIEKEDLPFYSRAFTTDTYLHLLAIASMNRSGYVREEAIKELAGLKHPGAIKFILYRLGDWVSAVRMAAEDAIRTYLNDEFVEVFLQQLVTIDQVLQVQRVDLSAIHSEIMQLIFSRKLTTDFLRTLKRLDDRTRFVYFRELLQSAILSGEEIDIIARDKNYLVRIELIKYIHNLDATKQTELIGKFLADHSARVRRSVLFETARFPGRYNDAILEMASDESASVRSLARYLLGDSSINFADLYREQLAQNRKIVGNIWGLSEVGTKDDLRIYEEYIQHSSYNVKLACLGAIHKIDVSIGKKYALYLLLHPVQKIRNKSIEILAPICDKEVLISARSIYQQGDVEQRKTMLLLFNKIGGWHVAGDLMLALIDDSEQLRELAWMFLQKWKQKAGSLFSTPPQDELQRANEIYRQLDISKTTMNHYREDLLRDLQFYLR